MPLRPPRACRQTGCAALTTVGYCPTHGGELRAQQAWVKPAGTAPKRMGGRKWMALRLRVLSEEPTCYRCSAFAHAEDIVDHVVSLAAGGTDARENLRRCCRACHTTKTQREATQGRR